jgi:hypothetical protein
MFALFPRISGEAGGFCMGKYEVAQGEYEAALGTNSGFFKGPACRAGTTGPFSTGNNITTGQTYPRGPGAVPPPVLGPCKIGARRLLGILSGFPAAAGSTGYTPQAVSRSTGR